MPQYAPILSSFDAWLHEIRGLAVLYQWPDKDLPAAIDAHLLLVYTVAAASLLNIGREELSSSDFFFATAILLSPFTWTLLIDMVIEVLGRKLKGASFKSLWDDGVIDKRLLALIILPIGFAMALIAIFSRKAFTDSACRNGTFSEWLLYALPNLPFVYRFFAFNNPIYAPFIAFIIFCWLVYLARDRHHIAIEWRKRRSQQSNNYLKLLLLVPSSWYNPHYNDPV